MAYSGRSGSRKPGGSGGNRGKSGSKPPFKRGGSSRDDDRPAFKKKPFGDRDDKPAFKKRDGERGKRDEGGRGFKKPFGDKPAFKRRDDDDRPRKSFGDRDDKPAFKRRSSDARPDERPFGRGDDRPKKSYGDRDDKPAFKRRSSEGDDRPRKSFGDRDDKPAFKRRSSDARPDERPFGRGDDRPRKPFGDRDDKPAFKRRSSDARPDERPFVRGDDRPRKPFGDRDDKPAFKRRSSGGDDRPRKSFGGKPAFGDKPAFRKPFGPKDSSRSDRNDRRGSGAAPSWKRGGRSESSFGEKKRGSDEGEWKTFDNQEEASDFKKSYTPRKAHRGQEDESDGSIRLNKYVANTGLCSRREADEMIEAGVIKVNGKIVTQLGTKVGPGDTVHYGDQLLRREKLVYVLLNKPKDYITTTDDPQDRKTVLDLVTGAGEERIYPVGRLDRNTTGVLLLTNDGDLAERLMHPKYNVEKMYQVSLDMNLRKEDFDKLLEGVELEDGYIKADDLSYVGDGEDHKEVGIVLHSGRNRIVRRVFEHLGYTVKYLDRVGYAGLTKKNVPKGKWRFLEPKEVGFLKMKVGGDKEKGRSPIEGGNKNAGRGKRGVAEKPAPVRKTKKPKEPKAETESED